MMAPLAAQNLDDKGEIMSQQVHTAGLASEEEERRSSQNMEEQSAQNKVIETAFRLEQAMAKMSIKKTKALWEKRYETIKEEEKPQSNKDVTVQCIDFCEATTSKVHAVLRHVPPDLRGGTLLQHPRVLVATVTYHENAHLCLQILHAARFQVFRGAHILLRILAVAESQEAQGLLEEIRRQPSVFVPSGPAVVISKVATASALLADGWSTESVSRVVRSARTRQENNEKERAEHACYSHIHDEVMISDAFPTTVQGLEEGENPTENTTPEDDQGK